jgi:hypothetical protein
MTKHFGCVASCTASYFGGPGFEFHPASLKVCCNVHQFVVADSRLVA